MIEGGASYIAVAYGLTVVLLGGLALVVFLRARHWAKRAKASDRA